MCVGVYAGLLSYVHADMYLQNKRRTKLQILEEKINIAFIQNLFQNATVFFTSSEYAKYEQ